MWSLGTLKYHCQPRKGGQADHLPLGISSTSGGPQLPKVGLMAPKVGKGDPKVRSPRLLCPSSTLRCQRGVPEKNAQWAQRYDLLAQCTEMPLSPTSITVPGARRVFCAPFMEGGPLTWPWGSDSPVPPRLSLCPQPPCKASPAQGAWQLFDEGIKEGIVSFCGGARGSLPGWS